MVDIPELMSEGMRTFFAKEVYRLRGWKFDEKGFRFNLHAAHPEMPLSPDYLDLRHLFRLPELRNMVASAFAPVVTLARPYLLLDLPLSISPVVDTLSNLTGIPYITIRGEALKGEKKDHGTPDSILGVWEPGNTVMIIDDVISGFAHTKMIAISILRDAGLVPISPVCVVVDREEGGREVLAREGFELVNLLTLFFLRRLYFELRLFPDEHYIQALEFSRTSRQIVLADIDID